MSHATKSRDVLSAVLRSAKEYGIILTNSAATVRVPADKRGKKKFKQNLTPEQFEEFAPANPGTVCVDGLSLALICICNDLESPSTFASGVLNVGPGSWARVRRVRIEIDE